MVLFRQLARESVDLAAVVAKQLLVARCSEVEKEIFAVFHDHARILDQAVDAIASSETTRLKKDGAKQRLVVLGDLLQICEQCPAPLACVLP